MKSSMHREANDRRRTLLQTMAVAVLLALGTSSCAPHADTTRQAASATPVYLDLNRSFEDRAADLVSRMTLEEKVAQMQNNAPAIPRLGVPAYEWWNEGLHGVARAGGATVFPQAIGLAATFDTTLMGQVATAVSDEARAKHQEFLRHDMHGRYEGLTFWSPNINIFRDPRWGRGQETYGEDPFLTSRMGVAFVRGLQGDDPTYRKLDATAKHFAVHSGPESERHRFDVHPSERDLHDTYLPAFQALVQEGHVDAVMGAYNRVNGESASASPRLLGEILRKDWGFKGYVVSDCDSVDDIFARHKMVATAEEASSLAVKNGDDLNCGHTYAALVNAVHQGLITEGDIDVSLKRLMLARMRLGMFDPPERVRWAQIPYSVNQSPEHDALARRAAEASIVLLKNDGILPLSRELKHVAVIGPTADDVTALLGNYHGTPADPETILQGIREALPQAEVTYAKGASLVQGFDGQGTSALIEARYLRPSADATEHGLKAEYFRGNDFASTPVLTRVDPKIGFQWDHGTPTDDLIMRGELPSDRALAIHEFSVRWSGQLLPPMSGRYEVSAPASDGYRLYVDGHLVLDAWGGDPTAKRPNSAFVDLKAGKAYDVRLEYANNSQNHDVRLAWRLPGAKPPLEEALEAARHADVVIYVGGLNSDVEGEEMKVNYPGFAGGDRTDLRLPATQEKLLEALRRTGKPMVMVLTSGSALAIDWARQHVPGIVLAWYPGQRGGNAVADVLFGAVSPAGRLPVTFYKASEKLPAFDNYGMSGRTYRYFEGTPLYPFGYGLSYTSFGYSGLALDRDSVARDGSMHVTVKVKNTGHRAGDEVVQLYLRPLQAKGTRAQKDLRGFQRITLQPDEEREVSFTVSVAKDLRYYDEQQHADAVTPGRYEVQVGASSADIRATTTFTVTP
ncbi:glycoside hydrolase family 3 C-terminal domain-containing protein [Dyella jiangningensis]|nr:glycoside hydrolase family 3 protein [Dyella jiangningensis]MDG2538591.1 glycoside hydrolase family 3 C-terminal domain-containing protein [Dyella jiangningensis]